MSKYEFICGVLATSAFVIILYFWIRISLDAKWRGDLIKAVQEAKE